MLARKALAGTAGAPKLYVEDVYSTYLYTGTGATLSINNGISLSTEGGLVWLKRRGVTGNNFLYDSARAVPNRLWTNSTAAQNTSETDTLTSFNSNGFSLGADATAWGVNVSGDTMASFTFRKAKKFFDVVTYTGDGSNRAISHNLGSVPGCMIIKRTDTTGNWATYHRSLGNETRLYLNTTDASVSGTSIWQSTTPTSTEFYVDNNSNVNANGGTYVAYLFAHDAGGFGDAGSDSIIKCGSYTGTSAVGNDQDLGFEPQWILIKRNTSGYDWELIDTMRGWAVGGADAQLRPNTSDAEYFATNLIDPTATGFRFSAGGATTLNTSGVTYYYIAIRRGPMKTPTSGTSVFAPYVTSSISNVGSSSNPLYNFGFLTDTIIQRNKAGTDGWYMGNRLQGTTYLKTETTAAEVSSPGLVWDSNVAAIAFSSANYGTYGFKRAPGFFDVVCTTGDGSGDLSFTHNLGVAPDLMIIKSRTGTFNWYIYCSQLSQPTKTYGTFTTDALTASSNTYFTVSSTTVTTSAGGWVANNGTGVVYLFATLAGVSKVGTYTGNGSSQTINCNFTNGARFILIKRTDSTGDWYVYDSARGIVSGNDPQLKLNSTAVEATGYDAIDPDNSGFIVNNDATNFPINVNNATYIYLAIA